MEDFEREKLEVSIEETAQLLKEINQHIEILQELKRDTTSYNTDSKMILTQAIEKLEQQFKFLEEIQEEEVSVLQGF